MSRRIEDLHESLQPIAREFVIKSNELLASEHQSIKTVITFTYRSFAEQDQLYSIGRRGIDGESIVTKAKGGYSWHNFGLAFDFAFQVNGKLSWDKSLPWSKVAKIAKDMGMEWGGDWVSLQDLGHLQYRQGMSLSEARKLYFQKKLDDAKAQLKAMAEELSKEFEIRGGTPYLTDIKLGKAIKKIRDPHDSGTIYPKPIIMGSDAEFGIKVITQDNENKEESE
jgi:hypothetical protein